MFTGGQLMPWPKYVAMWRTSIFALALVSSISASGRAATEMFSVGSWSGEARYANSGEFVRCTIKAEYQSGTSVTFGATATGGFEIWLYNLDWKLEEGRSYPISVLVDGQKIFDGSAEALAEYLIYISTDGSVRDRAISGIRKGYVMLIGTGLTAMKYQLTGTHAAIGRLLQCVENNTYARSNPFAGVTSPNGNGGEGPSKHFDGQGRSKSAASEENPTRDFMEMLKERAGLRTMTFIDAESLTGGKAGNRADVYWYFDGTMGTAMFLRGGDSSAIERAMKISEEVDRDGCPGLKHHREFSSLPNGIPVAVLRTQCAEYGNELFNIYRYFDLGDTLLLLTTSSRDRAISKNADSAIYEAVRAAVSR